MDLTTDLPEVTLADVVLELRRIADALTPSMCGERHGDAQCVLQDRHVGHHVTATGRVHWLDDD